MTDKQKPASVSGEVVAVPKEDRLVSGLRAVYGHTLAITEYRRRVGDWSANDHDHLLISALDSIARICSHHLAGEPLAAALEAATPSAVGGSIPSALFEARKRLSLAEGCLDCNADDERLWRFIIQFLEEYPWSTTATTTNAGAADTPAAIKAPSAVGGLLDARPQLDAATPEPSLREIVYGYYRAHFAPDDAEKLTARYLAAFAPKEAPSAVGGVDRMREALLTTLNRTMQPDHWDGTWEQAIAHAQNTVEAALASGELSPDRGRG